MTDVLMQRAAPTVTFEEFYRQSRPGVLGAVYALTPDWPAAEEITQNAFLRAYRHWRRVRSLERPDLWVRREALNLATSRWRRVQAEALALLRVRTPGSRASAEDHVDRQDTVRRAVRELPRRQAQAVVLHYLQDMPAADVAEVMGCAAGTVRAHLHAARQTLDTRLAEERPR